MEQILNNAGTRGSTEVRALRSFTDLFALNSQPGLAMTVAAAWQAGPIAAALPLASWGSRVASNAMVRGQAGALENMVGQTDAQRVAMDALLRSPNALAPLAQGSNTWGLLDYMEHSSVELRPGSSSRCIPILGPSP